MAYPTTADEIRAKLDIIDAAMDLYRTNPATFAEQIGGTIKVSIPQYMDQLRQEREYWQKQLDEFPFWGQSDVEAAI